MTNLKADPKLQRTLNRWPPLAATTVFSLQWLVILVPGLLVVGDLVAMAWGLDPAGRIAFLQRLLVIIGLVQGAQVLVGHRMPGLAGPSSVLLVGIISTVGSGPASVYGAMAIGGALMALLGAFGLAARLGRLYTPPVLASTLMLIAVNLAPALQGMIFGGAGPGRLWGAPFIFAMVLSGLVLWAQMRFRGLLGSSMLVLAMVVGSVAYYGLGLAEFPGWQAMDLPAHFSLIPNHGLSFDPAVTAAFLICFLALISNELGTLESLGHMLDLPDMDKRVSRSVLVGGLGNVASALGGTLGPVTYSVSPGVVLATHNASRWTLLPAAAVTVLLGLWPQGMAVFQLVPPPVSGVVVFCLMALTAFASLSILDSGGGVDRRSGLVLGASMVCGMVITFMPAQAKDALHPFLRPIMANGFVAGLLLAMVLEHTLPRPKAR